METYDPYDRAMQLAAKGYGCAQIIIQLGLEAEEEDNNPGLLRAVDALNMGFGGTRDMCGCLSGGACLLGYYAGIGEPGLRREHDLSLMVSDFREWFWEYNKEYQSQSCAQLIGENHCNKPMRCPQMMIDSYQKCMEILEDYDVL